MEKKRKFFRVKDRKLGDEWLNWNGNIKNSDKISNAGKRVYMGVLLFSILIGSLLAFLIWYLISPRLEQFHPALPLIFGIIICFIWSVIALWFLIMVLSIMTGKDLLLKFRGKEFLITFLIPVVFNIGNRLGISRDLLGSSFVKVSNTLIRASSIKVKAKDLLILLPRCLNKSIINKIKEYSEPLKISVFIVAGGEKARQIVYDKKPGAIIGVACERDLLSAIKDIIDKIPVIGIPNKRPEGPCKNTIIDFNEFKKAVELFLTNPSSEK